jgi:hypothetical protein
MLQELLISPTYHYEITDQSLINHREGIRPQANAQECIGSTQLLMDRLQVWRDPREGIRLQANAQGCMGSAELLNVRLQVSRKLTTRTLKSQAKLKYP